MRILLLGLAVFGSVGCMTAGSLVKELKGDPATVCVSYVGIYGNFQVSRTASSNARITCSKDGLTVTTKDITP